MADQVTNYKCPACSGSMHYSGSEDKLVCDYCDTRYSVEEIEALYKADNESAVQAKADADAKAEAGESDDWAVSNETWTADGMMTYSCPQCGAELICESTQGAFSCPYCGNPTTIPGQFSGMLKPDYVIPFKYEKKQAVEALQKHYGNRFLLPKAFKDTNHLQEVKGVYVPFWLYDGVASGNCTYEGIKSKTYKKGDMQITEKDIYAVERRGTMEFEKIPADASTKMDDALMDSIEPYDYKGLKPFVQAYLTGYLADKYDVSAEDNKERACKRAKESTKAALKADVKGYNTVSSKSEKVKVKQGKVNYAMMPVWLLHTKWNNQDFTFAMNGQTGKMVGDLPVDGMKLGITSVLIAIITFALCTVFGLSAGVSAIAALILAGIIVAVLYSGMKSVVKESAADKYVTKSGVKITFRDDKFIRKDIEKRKIEKKD